MSAPVLRPLSLGEVLDVSFGIYRARFVALFVIGVLTRLPSAATALVWNRPAELMSQPILMLGLYIIALLMSVVGIAASTLIVSRTYMGQPMTAGEALKNSIPFIWKLSLIAFLSGLAVVVGTIFLIIPGIIFFLGYSLATPIAVIEAPISATGAMGRSWRLTEGHRFRILGGVLIPLLLLIVPTIAGGILAAIFNLDGTIFAAVLISAISVLFYPFFYLVLGVFYYDLRVRKEGLDLELMAEAMPAE